MTFTILILSVIIPECRRPPPRVQAAVGERQSAAPESRGAALPGRHDDGHGRIHVLGDARAVLEDQVSQSREPRIEKGNLARKNYWVTKQLVQCLLEHVH